MTRALAADGVSRRATFKILALGGVASLFGGRFASDAEAARCGDPRCRRKNWCVDREHTCGPKGGYGKCLIKKNGGNVCAEILFQAQSCDDCKDPSCVDCVCALAAGGGDRCNNGANGYDFICARRLPAA